MFTSPPAFPLSALLLPKRHFALMDWDRYTHNKHHDVTPYWMYIEVSSRKPGDHVFWPRDLDLWPMTFIFEVVLDMVQMDVLVKFLARMSNGSVVRERTHTHTQTGPILLPQLPQLVMMILSGCDICAKFLISGMRTDTKINDSHPAFLTWNALWEI